MTLCGNVMTLCGNVMTLCGNVRTVCGNVMALCGNVMTLCGNEFRRVTLHVQHTILHTHAPHKCDVTALLCYISKTQEQQRVAPSTTCHTPHKCDVTPELFDTHTIATPAAARGDLNSLLTLSRAW